jgi:hypothetical protein
MFGIGSSATSANLNPSPYIFIRRQHWLLAAVVCPMGSNPNIQGRMP